MVEVISNDGVEHIGILYKKLKELLKSYDFEEI